MPQFDLQTVITDPHMRFFERFVGPATIAMPADWTVLSAQCVYEDSDQAMVTVVCGTPKGPRTDTLMLGRRRVAVAVTLIYEDALRLLVTSHDRLGASDPSMELPWTYIRDSEPSEVAATRALETMGGKPGVTPDRLKTLARLRDDRAGLNVDLYWLDLGDEYPVLEGRMSAPDGAFVHGNWVLLTGLTPRMSRTRMANPVLMTGVAALFGRYHTHEINPR